jgi:glycosyltransferase involved in cell wall biosynthesis
MGPVSFPHGFGQSLVVISHIGDEHAGGSGLSSFRLAHVITGLGVGGAESFLLRLAQRLQVRGFDQRVYSLTSDGPIGERLHESGIPVEALGLIPNRPNPIRLLRLARELSNWRPDAVQTWMYHGDWLGTWAARRAKCPRIFWGLRNSTLEADSSKKSTVWVRKRLARLSAKWPTAVVSCSKTASDLHVSLGYDASKMILIPNGIDSKRFRPDPSVRAERRAALGIAQDAVVFGHAGRFHPQKGHSVFLEASIRAARERPNARFLLCGLNVTPKHEPFLSVAKGEWGHRFIFAGPQDDMPSIYNALDVFVMSSTAGEAFPNVVAEAMACGIPAIVTDIGDAAEIVGPLGTVVPIEPVADLGERLAQAMCGCLTLELSLSGGQVRDRMVASFDLDAITDRYADLYRSGGCCPCAD